jgi:AcrR family transcriptional regulator
MSPRIGADLPTILKAAAELADARGLAEVTMASLAEKLNIRSPSLYNHVNGLGELRTRLAQFALEQLADSMERGRDGAIGREALRRIAHSYVDFARARPGLYEATLRAADPGDSGLQEAAERVVQLVLHALGEYGLAGGPALHAVRGVRSLIHGFASLEQKGGFAMPLSLDESFELLIDAFLGGLDVYRNMEQTE